MRILILTLGTRGDVELFLNLARVLLARGHRPHLVTSQLHAHRATGMDIDCTPIGTTTASTLDALLASLAPIADLRARTLAYVNRFLRPELAAATPALEKLTATADYFISNLKITVTRNARILPTAFVTYDPPASLDELDRYSANLDRSRILELVAFPRPLIDPAARWPDRFHFTGFWQPTHSAPLPPEVSAFLAAGPPPIILTTGSMKMADPTRLAATFTESLARTNHRGILINPGATANPGAMPCGAGAPLGMPRKANPPILATNEIPYPALFPHAAAIIHHGGVGAVAETLRAAKPTIVMPQILAQRHIADLLQNAGLSAATLDPATLTPHQLAAAIHEATSNTRYSLAATQLQKTITTDPGIQAAATAIENHAK